MEFDIVRVWKDARYRQNLTSEQLALLPENPAGTCELTDSDLEAVQGSVGGSTGSNAVGGQNADCIFSFGAYGIDNCNTNGNLINKCGYNF